VQHRYPNLYELCKRMNAWLLFIITMAAVFLAYDTLRPWATRGEFATVEARSCANQFSILYENLRATRRELFNARQFYRIPAADPDVSEEWVFTLEEDLEDISRRLEKTEVECGGLS